MKIVALAYIATAAAQFGSRNFKAGGPTGNGDVDLAMAGWEQLSRNPDKMQEVMHGMKVWRCSCARRRDRRRERQGA